MSNRVTLLNVAVSGLVPGQAYVTDALSLGRLPDAAEYLAAQARFVYDGSDGVGINVFLQTTLDDGVTWCDIGNFLFETTSAIKIHAMKLSTALAANTTPTDGGLTANTILSGLIGNKIRLKYQVSASALATGGELAYENGTNPSNTKTVTIPVGGGNPDAVYTFRTGDILATGGKIVYTNATQPTPTKIVTIPVPGGGPGDDAVYTFVVGPVAAAGDILIGADEDVTMQNFVDAINGVADDANHKCFGGDGVAHPMVSATLNVGGHEVAFTVLQGGTVGNIDITTDEASFTVTDPSGGVDSLVTTPGEVAIGADADATMLNLTRCINNSGAGDYIAWNNAAHPLVSAAHDAGGDTVDLTVLTAGSVGNITITTDEASITPTSPTGGVDGTYANGTLLVVDVAVR